MTKEDIRIIPKALALYKDLQLLRRQLRCMTERDVIDECVNSWLMDHMPEGARWPEDDDAQFDEYGQLIV